MGRPHAHPPPAASLLSLNLSLCLVAIFVMWEASV